MGQKDWRVAQKGNLAWVAAQDMAPAGAAVLLAAWGRLGTTDKMAFLMVGFLREVVGTLQRRLAVLVEAVQIRLREQEDNRLLPEGTDPAARWPHQTFLPYWQPSLPCNLC